MAHIELIYDKTVGIILVRGGDFGTEWTPLLDDKNEFVQPELKSGVYYLPLEISKLFLFGDKRDLEADVVVPSTDKTVLDSVPAGLGRVAYRVGGGYLLGVKDKDTGTVTYRTVNEATLELETGRSVRTLFKEAYKPTVYTDQQTGNRYLIDAQGDLQPIRPNRVTTYTDATTGRRYLVSPNGAVQEVGAGSIEQQVAQAVASGDMEKARGLADFAGELSVRTDPLRARQSAIDLAQSPGDLFTYLSMLRGKQSTGQFTPSWEGGRAIPGYAGGLIGGPQPGTPVFPTTPSALGPITPAPANIAQSPAGAVAPVPQRWAYDPDTDSYRMSSDPYLPENPPTEQAPAQQPAAQPVAPVQPVAPQPTSGPSQQQLAELEDLMRRQLQAEQFNQQRGNIEAAQGNRAAFEQVRAAAIRLRESGVMRPPSIQPGVQPSQQMPAASAGPITSQLGVGLQAAFSGQAVPEPRPAEALAGLQIVSPQGWRNLTPTERSIYTSEFARQGIPAQDTTERFNRTFSAYSPRRAGPIYSSPQRRFR